MEEQQPIQKKRVRDDSAEHESDSPEVKRMRDDLLGILDNSDDRDPSSHDLDSVMRSFEEELSGSGYTLPSTASAVMPGDAPVVNLSSSPSGETRAPELGFFLEALDDELGLPTTATTDTAGKEQEKDVEAKKGGVFVDDVSELVGLSSDSSTITEFWPFDDADVPTYDSFGFGIDGGGNNDDRDSGGNFVGDSGGEYVALDGIFDYSDINFGSSDYSDGSRRPTSLPAL